MALNWRLTKIKFHLSRHEWNEEAMSHYQRCPGGFLGLRPPSLYASSGYDMMRGLDLGDKEVYIHHVNIDKTSTVIVTNSECLSVSHNKSRSMLRINWRLNISEVHDLPTVEDHKLTIHLASRSLPCEPVTIECESEEKLNSVRLALEYAVLLTMPFSCSTIPRLISGF